MPVGQQTPSSKQPLPNGGVLTRGDGSTATLCVVLGVVMGLIFLSGCCGGSGGGGSTPPASQPNIGLSSTRLTLPHMDTGSTSPVQSMVLGTERSVQADADVVESWDQLAVATLAKELVFVHAGVVGWRNRAIVIPGRSLSGKSTLVLALVVAVALKAVAVCSEFLAA